VAVIEVGLGGRLDATNIISPLVSVITSLSFDHTAWLGNTLAQIAAEKAGIIKPGVPVVSAPQPSEALEVIEQHCRERNIPLVLVGRDWHFEPGDIDPEGQSFSVIPAGQSRYKHAKHVQVSLFLRLLGRHQLVNATVALAALSQASLGGIEVSPRHLRDGLDRVKWPARLEVLSNDPLVVCDGAHNGDSARQLTAALAEWFPGKEWTYIFGASADKDIAAMLDAFVPASRQMVLTRSHHPRAAEPEHLAKLVNQRGGTAHVTATMTEAIEAALAQAGPEGGVIATGSLFVAAEARAEWARRTGQPMPETDE
jgi:dihydrofolate synthase/folylpolyglutamate synthase